MHQPKFNVEIKNDLHSILYFKYDSINMIYTLNIIKQSSNTLSYILKPSEMINWEGFTMYDSYSALTF